MNMNMDVVLSGVYTIAKVLLPVVGVVCLVYVALLLKELIVTLKNVNGVIKKLDAPLNTVEELSHTVDDVHHKTKEVAANAAKATKENVETIKNWTTEKLAEIKSKQEGKQIESTAEEA